jgi:hypothetical protein
MGTYVSFYRGISWKKGKPPSQFCAFFQVFWTIKQKHLPKSHQLEPGAAGEWRPGDVPQGLMFLALLDLTQPI